MYAFNECKTNNIQKTKTKKKKKIISNSFVIWLSLGRLTYEGLNSAIEEYNSGLLSKYNFLRKGFPATGSMADKKKFKVPK